MSARATFRKALGRVLGRPVPWLLRYLITLVPALLVALALLFPLRRWVSHPLVADALRTRSLDLLLDAVMGLAEALSGGPVLLAGIALVPLVWAVFRLIWLFVEGGVLETYARPERLSAQGFLRACTYWLPTFLPLAAITVAAAGLVIALAAVGVGLVEALVLSPGLNAVVGVGGIVVLVAVHVLSSLARGAAVVGGDRNVWRAIGAGSRVAVRRLPAVVALVVGVLLARALLFVLNRALGSWLPMSWWLLTLLVQQAIQVVLTGLGLLRRAGEIALASSVVDPQPETSLPA